MNVAIVGTGYVGLVAGTCFADVGNSVTCVDIDPDKIKNLKSGQVPIYEPGLETLLQRNIKEGRLHFTTSMAEGIAQAEVVFLAVGTPPTSSGAPDLQFLKTAAEEIAKNLKGPVIVVNKSTVPVGSHEIVHEWMKPHARFQVEVISNPEFLKEGSAVEDFLKPDRVVIGTQSDAAFEKISELYQPFVRQGNPILRMDPISAEMTKYACNAFLATRISFMNELAQLCEKTGGDIDRIRTGMATDARIGKHFLYAGAGYGGSCFPKDVQALMKTGEKFGVPLEIVAATESANARQKKHLVNKIRAALGHSLQGKTFALWGLAFKPNTDDMREAPALEVIAGLLQAGAKVQAFDPVAMENAKKLLGESVIFVNSAYDALVGADALVIATEWNEFRNPDFKKLKSLLKNPQIFDGRNLFNPSQMKEKGIRYVSIGRP